MIALVTSVVPWASDAQGPAASAMAARPLSTPPAGFSGVVGTLSALVRPVAASQATRSVKVPPTSTPTRDPRSTVGQGRAEPVARRPQRIERGRCRGSSSRGLGDVRRCGSTLSGKLAPRAGAGQGGRGGRAGGGADIGGRAEGPGAD